MHCKKEEDLGQVRSQLIRANDVGYLTKEEYNELYTECRKFSAGIMNFIKELRASEYTGAKFNDLVELNLKQLSIIS